MSGLYDTYDAKTNQMRNATPEEREAYERMLGKMSMPLMQEQEYMQRINRLMLHVGRLKEQNEQLRELARDLRFCARQSNCLKCEHGRFCDLRLDERCAELGIEVDE